MNYLLFGLMAAVFMAGWEIRDGLDRVARALENLGPMREELNRIAGYLNR
jgi:hypothetical protein